MLIECEIDLEIFESMDIDEQYEVIDELERFKRDAKRERFIEAHDDLSKFSEV